MVDVLGQGFSPEITKAEVMKVMGKKSFQLIHGHAFFILGELEKIKSIFLTD